MMRVLSVLLISVLFLACSDKQETADALYINAVVWTGLEDAADATSFAVQDGLISNVGNTHGIDADRTIDLEGRFVMPGFMDNHVHFMEGGAALASVDLRDANTRAVFTKRIIDYAAGVPKGRWVLNGNWDHELWGGELPHKNWIDPGTENTPVYVIRLDGHMALANSAALKIAGINSATEAPAGGEIIRDANGEPTGILKGNALNLVLQKIPAPSDDELMDQFALAQKHALSLGLTQVHAVTAYPTETTMLQTFQLAQHRGLLNIRASVSTPIESWQDARDVMVASGRGDEKLGWGGIKGFIDGSLGAGTAWLHEPYTDAPDSMGIPLNDPAELKHWMQGADAAGLRLSIHALGDKGIDTVVENMRDIAGDAIAQRRFRIEHFQHPTAATFLHQPQA
jgi:predicted amidohydrolase YtcJ